MKNNYNADGSAPIPSEAEDKERLRWNAIARMTAEEAAMCGPIVLVEWCMLHDVPQIK